MEEKNTGKPLKKFAVYAGYRGPEFAKRPYYVKASSKKEAKIKFKEVITWLDVYSVEEVVESENPSSQGKGQKG